MAIPLYLNNPHTNYTMRKEISILEDDWDIMEVFRLLLNDEGYKVNSFANVSSLLASTAKPDLYLLDIRLPDGNGIEVCEQLKDDPRFSGIPIMMLSAHADKSVMMKNCRADEFMEKPFDIDRLLERVAALLSLHKGRKIE